MKNDRYSKFREMIKTALEEKRITGRQLSLKVGVHPSYINLVLAGKRNPPTDEIIMKIADALGINRENLLMEAGLLPDGLRDAIAKSRLFGLMKKEGFSSVKEYFEAMDRQTFIVRVKDEKTGKWKTLKPKNK